VHPRYRTPHVTTWVTGIAVAASAGMANINEVVELTNIGTLFAFLLVCLGVTVLRHKEPERPRPFRVPLGPWLIPGLGAMSCLFLMVYLPPASWWRFVGWLVLGMAVYFSYGYHHSAVGRAAGRPARATTPQRLVALGALLAGVGLFVIPHDAGPAELWREATGAGTLGHGRAVAGLPMIGLGAALGLAGWLAGSAGRAARIGSSP
jgi:APA family basic amino acid/polyamine antiporter